MGSQQDMEENILVITLYKSPEKGLGFFIAGGTDDCIEPGDEGIYISDITVDGPAGIDGRIQFGDQLLEVNGRSLTGLTHGEVVDVLRACAGSVTLKLARLPANDEAPEQLLQIDLETNFQGLGFSIVGGVDQPVEEGDDGVYITSILDDGTAQKDGRLQLGDKIVEVNGHELSGLQHHEIVNLLQASGNVCHLTVSRVVESVEV